MGDSREMLLLFVYPDIVCTGKMYVSAVLPNHLTWDAAITTPKLYHPKPYHILLMFVGLPPDHLF